MSPCTCLARTGEERRRSSWGVTFSFVVGKKVSLGRIVLCAHSVWSHHQKGRPVVGPKGGGGEGTRQQGGPGERERQRARGWGVRPGPGSGGKGPGGPLRLLGEARGGEQAAGLAGSGGGGSRSRAASGTKKKPACPDSSASTSVLLDCSPSGFLLLKHRERCLPSRRPHVPGRLPQDA